MKKLFKRHIGLIIILIIVLVFPTSLQNQARLNMRIIVTGLAIDKVNSEYEITAQIAKIKPGNQSPGTNATIDFITDRDETLSGAVSKLSYKAGKVAAFSHTGFVIMGNSLLSEDVTKCLDYFIRDKVINNSALLLFAEDSAKDEIKKTKNIELSVGLGIQKVYLFKERDGDGIMKSVLSFLNENKNFSKTATASIFKLESNEESIGEGGAGGSSNDSSSGGSSSQNSASSGSGSGSSSGLGDSSTSGNGGSGSGSSGSSSGGGQSEEEGLGMTIETGSSGSGGGNETQFFKPRSPILCFVDGRYVGKLEDNDELAGYMLANPKTDSFDLNINIKDGSLAGTKIAINIKKKHSKIKVHFENGVPYADIDVKILNAEINEILTEKVIADLDDDEFYTVVETIKTSISDMIKTCHVKSQDLGADLFGAFENAYKFNCKETDNYKLVGDFVRDLKLNVNVEVDRLDY